MENFSTVLWIVVIAAAMIFNVVSQSRKQAKKQARQAGDRARRSEAWPSWDPAAGAATGFKGGHSRPAGGAAGRGAGATPTMAPSAGFEDAAPAAGSGHTASPQRAQRRAKRPHDSHGASPSPRMTTRRRMLQPK